MTHIDSIALTDTPVRRNRTTSHTRLATHRAVVFLTPFLAFGTAACEPHHNPNAEREAWLMESAVELAHIQNDIWTQFVIEAELDASAMLAPAPGGEVEVWSGTIDASTLPGTPIYEGEHFTADGVVFHVQPTNGDRAYLEGFFQVEISDLYMMGSSPVTSGQGDWSVIANQDPEVLVEHTFSGEVVQRDEAYTLGYTSRGDDGEFLQEVNGFMDDVTFEWKNGDTIPGHFDYSDD